MNSSINLHDLKIERPKTALTKPRRRAWISRIVVPAAIILGFFSVIGWAMRDRFVTRRLVTVAPVFVTRAEIQNEGTPLFQAAGWVEPRPTAVNISALTEGVVRELLVVEGQSVEVDQPIAHLIDVDAQLTLREMKNSLTLQDAELRSAQAELKAAKLRYEHPVHLEALVAEAQSNLERMRSERIRLPFLIKSSEAQLEYAKSNFEGKRIAGAAVSGRSLQLAESEFQSADANLNELKHREPNLKREEDALQKKVDALSKQLALLIDESRQMESAAAKEQAAVSNREQASVSVERARLNLDRCTVRSPVCGRVMQLIAQPGMRVMGLETTATRSSNTVVTLYNPGMLQVRADVRLEDVPLVQPGQPVQVQTAASKVIIEGIVLRSTSSANIQKNTLEVKVALTSPSDHIRPEMLVTATFLAPPTAKPDQPSTDQNERLLVPRALITTTTTGATVWIVDASGCARHRSIKLGKAGSDQLIEVVEGLVLTDKLIAGGTEGLREGESVQVSFHEQGTGF